ncbi:hypothetical protein ADUPG1_012382 [Aduncisulcus paluster]|uniref:Uncharacterized protein n=1 Tax=Aduncisulcus paluster TaxID=2918883 RepID=A0ABQ5K016_9EUKA|nr:hypothetical protein ADUPG1_012382 [Aduncisulcus paluster]
MDRQTRSHRGPTSCPFCFTSRSFILEVSKSVRGRVKKSDDIKGISKGNKGDFGKSGSKSLKDKRSREIALVQPHSRPIMTLPMKHHSRRDLEKTVDAANAAVAVLAGKGSIKHKDEGKRYDRAYGGYDQYYPSSYGPYPSVSGHPHQSSHSDSFSHSDPTLIQTPLSSHHDSPSHDSMSMHSSTAHSTSVHPASGGSVGAIEPGMIHSTVMSQPLPSPSIVSEEPARIQARGICQLLRHTCVYFVLYVCFIMWHPQPRQRISAAEWKWVRRLVCDVCHVDLADDVLKHINKNIRARGPLRGSRLTEVFRVAAACATHPDNVEIVRVYLLKIGEAHGTNIVVQDEMCESVRTLLSKLKEQDVVKMEAWVNDAKDKMKSGNGDKKGLGGFIPRMGVYVQGHDMKMEMDGMDKKGVDGSSIGGHDMKMEMDGMDKKGVDGSSIGGSVHSMHLLPGLDHQGFGGSIPHDISRHFLSHQMSNPSSQENKKATVAAATAAAKVASALLRDKKQQHEPPSVLPYPSLPADFGYGGHPALPKPHEAYSDMSSHMSSHMSDVKTEDEVAPQMLHSSHPSRTGSPSVPYPSISAGPDSVVSSANPSSSHLPDIVDSFRSCGDSMMTPHATLPHPHMHALPSSSSPSPSPSHINSLGTLTMPHPVHHKGLLDGTMHHHGIHGVVGSGTPSGSVPGQYGDSGDGRTMEQTLSWVHHHPLPPHHAPMHSFNVPFSPSSSVGSFEQAYDHGKDEEEEGHHNDECHIEAPELQHAMRAEMGEMGDLGMEGMEGMEGLEGLEGLEGWDMR